MTSPLRFNSTDATLCQPRELLRTTMILTVGCFFFINTKIEIKYLLLPQHEQKWITAPDPINHRFDSMGRLKGKSICNSNHRPKDDSTQSRRTPHDLLTTAWADSIPVATLPSFWHCKTHAWKKTMAKKEKSLTRAHTHGQAQKAETQTKLRAVSDIRSVLHTIVCPSPRTPRGLCASVIGARWPPS